MSATAPNLRLYGYWRSSSTWRVRIALDWKGLAYDYHPLALVKAGGGEHKSEAYTRINPMQEVPVLEFPHGGRLERLSQSLAIVDYLERLRPDPALIPADPLRAAQARQLAEIINAGTQPLQNHGVLVRVRELGGDEQVWARTFIERGLAALEQVAGGTAGKFLVGDAVSIADLCLIPQLFNARRYGASISAFGTLLRVENLCLSLPAFVDTHPDRQPDAPKAS